MITQEEAIDICRRVKDAGGNVEAAGRQYQIDTGWGITTFRKRLLEADARYNITPDNYDTVTPVEEELSESERRRLQNQIRLLKNNLDGLSDLRQALFNLTTPTPSQIVFNPIPVKESHEESTPVILASDWQIGEVVSADEMDGINEFNMDV